MKRGVTASMAVFLLFGFLLNPSCSSNETLAQLQAEYNRESNPKHRVELAVALADQRMKLLLKAFDSGDRGEETSGVQNYAAAVDRLQQALRENSNKGAEKKAEIHLRQQVQALSDLRPTLSGAEQSSVETVFKRVSKLHEQVLYNVMNLRKPPRR